MTPTSNVPDAGENEPVTPIEPPTQYEPLRKANAKRTIAARDDALLQFDIFLEKVGISSDWKLVPSNRICQKELLEQFASFLATDARTKIGDPLMSSTAVDYFSRVKETLKGKYADEELWKLDEKKWYTPCRQALETVVERNAIMNGGMIQEKADPIGREYIKSIARALFRKNTMKSYKWLFAVVTTWLAVGRAGELAKSNWEGVSYNVDQGCLGLVWNEIKTVSQNDMVFYCDKDCPEADIFFVLACHLLVGANEKWLIPDMEKLKQPSSYINKILKQMVDDGVLPKGGDFTGTSLRIGSVNFMVNHPRVSLVQAIMRGGWAHTSICSIFHYLMKLILALSIGARALSGWNQVRVGAFSPRLVILSSLTDERRQALQNMRDSLFLSYLNTRLSPLFDCLLASLLMHLPYIMRTYTIDNLIVSQFMSVARKFGFELKDLNEFSSEIRKYWEARNFEESLLKEDNEEILDYIQRIFRDVQATLNDVKNSISRVVEQNEEILHYVRLNHYDSPTKKRKDAESIDPRLSKQLRVNEVSGSEDESDKLSEPAPVIKSINDELKRYAPRKIELNGLTVGVLFEKACEYKWFLNPSYIPLGTSQKDRSEKAKIIKVLSFIRHKVLTSEEFLEWVKKKAPDGSSPEHIPWASKLKTFSKEIEERFMIKLQELEGTVGIQQKKGGPSVGGVNNRILAVEKVQKDNSRK